MCENGDQSSCNMDNIYQYYILTHYIFDFYYTSVKI